MKLKGATIPDAIVERVTARRGAEPSIALPISTRRAPRSW